MGQAGLDITTKTVVSAETKYDEIKQELLKITAKREGKTETALTEKERGKNKEGIETVCYRCGEKVHISRNCNRREKKV